MSKKVAKNAVELTPRDLAIAQAKQLLELDLLFAEKTKEAESIKEKLKDYVKETGDKNLEYYTVSESEAKPKLNFGQLTANAQKRVVEVLMSELPDFVKSTTTLDTEKLYYSMSSTPSVSNALKVHGLKFDLVTSLTFKKVK